MFSALGADGVHELGRKGMIDPLLQVSGLASRPAPPGHPVTTDVATSLSDAVVEKPLATSIGERGRKHQACTISAGGHSLPPRCGRTLTRQRKR